ncbi:hypothetical protein F5Y15DRAFT_280852 [Xylariaceae sp. FL0016]|nr:hypothetical protein F5Y15DRAFT_280852 [Xylariaceae sp. FL0016]
MLYASVLIVTILIQSFVLTFTHSHAATGPRCVEITSNPSASFTQTGTQIVVEILSLCLAIIPPPPPPGKVSNYSESEQRQRLGKKNSSRISDAGRSHCLRAQAHHGLFYLRPCHPRTHMQVSNVKLS